MRQIEAEHSDNDGELPPDECGCLVLVLVDVLVVKRLPPSLRVIELIEFIDGLGGIELYLDAGSGVGVERSVVGGNVEVVVVVAADRGRMVEARQDPLCVAKTRRDANSTACVTAGVPLRHIKTSNPCCHSSSP